MQLDAIRALEAAHPDDVSLGHDLAGLQVARDLDLPTGVIEIRPRIHHFEIRDRARGTPDRNEIVQLGVDFDSLLGEREQLPRFTGEVPRYRHGRRERLSRVRVVERGSRMPWGNLGRGAWFATLHALAGAA